MVYLLTVRWTVRHQLQTAAAARSVAGSMVNNKQQCGKAEDFWFSEFMIQKLMTSLFIEIFLVKLVVLM